MEGKGRKRGVKEGQGMGSSGSLERNRRALKAIYGPQGAMGSGGVGLGQGTVQQTLG